MLVAIEDQDVEQQQRDDHTDRRQPCPAGNVDVDELGRGRLPLAITPSDI